MLQPRGSSVYESIQLVSYLVTDRGFPVVIASQLVVNASIAVFDEYEASDGSFAGRIIFVCWESSFSSFELFLLKDGTKLVSVPQNPVVREYIAKESQ